MSPFYLFIYFGTIILEQNVTFIFTMYIRAAADSSSKLLTSYLLQTFAICFKKRYQMKGFISPFFFLVFS